MFKKLNRLPLVLFASVVVSACQTTDTLKTSLTATDKGYFSVPTTMPWQGQKRNIGGELTFPEQAAGQKVPFVVIAHSADGINYAENWWKTLWLKEGYAVFMLDYWAPRGVAPGSARAPRSGTDVIDALEVLNTHPGLDPTRYAIQGLSNGSMVAASAMSMFKSRRMTNQPRAYLLNYGGCSQLAYVTTPAKEPAYRFYIGAGDAPASPRSCQEIYDNWSKQGVNVKAFIFPDVYHGFDGNVSKTVSYRGSQFTIRPNSKATNTSAEDAKETLRTAFN